MTQNPDLAVVLSKSKFIYSSNQAPLNDSSAEYVVHTVRHFFDFVIIIQYAVNNTLED
jgi:hypothetical protein